MKQLFLLLALLITSATISRAQESAEERLSGVIELQGQAKELKILGQAWSAYKSGDTEVALGLWAPLAEMGNPSAQVFMGLMYNQGDAVEQDMKETTKWYALASEQGNVPATWRLAILYYHGSGVTQDYQKAAELYHSAAKQGDVYSQKALGVMYRKGLGVPKDNVIAYSWFHIASESGFTLAKNYQNEMSHKMTPEEIVIAQAVAKNCVQSNYTKCGWLLSSDEDLIKGDP